MLTACSPLRSRALSSARSSGFSLIEVFVTMGIVMVLAAVVIPLTKNCINRAESVRELSGGRLTGLAWMSYATENNGSILPGYQRDNSAKNAKGQALSFPANARYVYRLAPYLDYQLKGSVLVNKQAKLTDDYAISVSPSFGINLTFVGGDFGSGTDLLPSEQNFSLYGKFVVTKLVEIHSPSKLIVFASARFNDPSIGDAEGYNAVKSPYFSGRRWPEAYNESRPYYDFGNIHPRFNNSAVCVMADGHVEMLSYEELLDMRRWSNQAAQADDPNWTLQTL